MTVRIAFFDSGIGGLTVLHQALQLLPNEDYIFYADTLHVPYGEKPKHEVKQYVFDAIDFIAQQGVKAVVIACNTATSIAIDDARKKYDFPIIGMEPAVKPAIRNSEVHGKRVLVLATKLTLSEQKFHSLVKNLDSNNVVDTMPLPGLVEFAEKFEFRQEVIVPYLRHALSSLNLTEYGTVVLGCTHFPYFRDSLKQLFDPDVDMIDGNVGTIKHLERTLAAKNQLNGGTGDIIFFKSNVRVDDSIAISQYRHALQMLSI